MDGPDHSFSLEPDELSQMVDSIRNTESVLGDGSLGVRAVESASADRGLRSIFAVTDISDGETITEDSVEVLRPGNLDRDGAHPKFINDIVGATATTAIQDGDPVSFDQVDIDSE
jgi:sialic acid synthase SpsE